jgi:hypothetical protein
MKKYFLLISSVLISQFTNGQYHIDALRFSKETLNGTARFMSMGGAFGSLGGNPSSLNFNPAGVSVYTSSEFSFSFDFSDIETSTKFHNTNVLSVDSKNSIPNLNYISANIFDPNEFGDWNRLNFAIGYNKLDDYNETTYILANQNEHSLASNFLNNAQGYYPENLNLFNELLAFNTYLIDTISGNNSTYFSYVDPLSEKNQSYYSIKSGQKNEFYLSFGSAYKDKLFMGMTIGFPWIQFNQFSNISEYFINDSVDSTNSNNIESFSYNSNLWVSGSGINLKLGLIYQIDENLRYGFAIHTPTAFQIQEEFSSRLITSFQNNIFESESGLGFFDYDLSTPFKILNSVSYIFDKKAILSIDYEYLDYSSLNLNSDFYNLSESNQDIAYYYSVASNIRIGGEFRIHPQFSLRGGYAYYGSPFLGMNERNIEVFSFGGGLRINQYFLDFAVVNSFNEDVLSLYNSAPNSSITTSKNQITWTAGFKF